jgi:hypothetical protein
LPTLARPRVHKIAELAYLIAPIASVDSNITEHRSAIPLFTIIFTPKVRNSGSLCRYPRECDEIRNINGNQFLYCRSMSIPLHQMTSNCMRKLSPLNWRSCGQSIFSQPCASPALRFARDFHQLIRCVAECTKKAYSRLQAFHPNLTSIFAILPQ